jgi:hypothetical protein
MHRVQFKLKNARAWETLQSEKEQAYRQVHPVRTALGLEAPRQQWAERRVRDALARHTTQHGQDQAQVQARQQRQQRVARVAAYARTHEQLRAQKQVLGKKSRVLEQGFAELVQARQQAALELDRAQQEYAAMQQAWRQDAAQHPVRTSLKLTQRRRASKLEAAHEQVQKAQARVGGTKREIERLQGDPQVLAEVGQIAQAKADQLERNLVLGERVHCRG